ncbi:uncharacterized protein LOC117118595 [Anneissia japonica]|uniref:uncharacterized protein LOC117118595 n=1 Tax=Anneissia japonica TaxID=1529436 RepID=UPI00142596A7|nr:uncharacterized protein LOC117118595 [Anneissia japonica]
MVPYFSACSCVSTFQLTLARCGDIEVNPGPSTNLTDQRFTNSTSSSTPDNVRNNPKRFWTWMKTKTKSSSYPSVMSYGDRVAETAKEKAIIFNSFFHSVFQKDVFPITEQHLALPEASLGVLALPVIQPESVYKLLTSLKIHKAIGCDELSNHVLMVCARPLSISDICHIFNTSLTTDDLNIFQKVEKLDDADKLQGYLDKLCSWSHLWGTVLC